MPLTTIPTYILDKVIADGRGGVTIDTFRSEQLAALPFDCPNCEDTSGLVTILREPGSEYSVQIPCPLCLGMAKTLVEYTATTDAFHWMPVPPDPPDGTIPPPEP